MESAQRDIISVLLEHIFSMGLISKNTYLMAEDLVYTDMDFPQFLWYPVCLPKEGLEHECSQDSQ